MTCLFMVAKFNGRRPDAGAGPYGIAISIYGRDDHFKSLISRRINYSFKGLWNLNILWPRPISEFGVQQ
jgi:hypothetical protein